MRRTVFAEEHEQFRSAVQTFVAREVVPNVEAWEEAGIIDREVYRTAGKHGLIGFNIPGEYGRGRP